MGRNTHVVARTHKYPPSPTQEPLCATATPWSHGAFPNTICFSQGWVFMVVVDAGQQFWHVEGGGLEGSKLGAENLVFQSSHQIYHGKATGSNSSSGSSTDTFVGSPTFFGSLARSPIAKFTTTKFFGTKSSVMEREYTEESSRRWCRRCCQLVVLVFKVHMLVYPSPADGG